METQTSKAEKYLGLIGNQSSYDLNAFISIKVNVNYQTVLQVIFSTSTTKASEYS